MSKQTRLCSMYGNMDTCKIQEVNVSFGVTPIIIEKCINCYKVWSHDG